MADELTPTPEEIAQYENLTSSTPAPVNPIRDLSADDLFSLATNDPDNFNLIAEFRRNSNLRDPETIQKVADVHNRIKQRGFELKDIPGPGKVFRTVFDIAKGFGKQAWNYANALVGVPIASVLGEITGAANQPGFTQALEQEGQRRVLESFAGTEAGMFGVARLGEKAISKVSGTASNLTPEQKVSDFWKDVGLGEVEEKIAEGKGGLLEPVGGEIRKELEAAGKPVRSEEVQVLAAGDPAAFWTFGKIFQGAGKLVPGKVAAGAEKIVAKADAAAEVVAGRGLQAAGKLTELGGKAVKIAGPAVGLVKGAIEAGPLGALAGLKAGEIGAKIGGKLAKAGQKVAGAGEQIAGAVPVRSGATQLAKDVAGSVPMTAYEIGKGAAFDIGTAAITSENPQDTQSVGIGMFFGGLGAARRAGGRVISGQLVGPREWGSNKVVPSSGQLPVFDAMHAEAIKTVSPAIQTRLNAVREFLKGANTEADLFLLPPDISTAEKALTDAGISPEQAKTLAAQEGFFTANIPGKDGNVRRAILARNIDAAPHEAFHAIQDVLGENANQAIDQIVREEYGPQWEAEGARYASRIGPGEWREVILDATGTGLNYAKEKIAMDIANEYRTATGAEPPSGFVQDRVKSILGNVMDSAVRANPEVDPNAIARNIWRDIMSPQEATAVADSYLARELAAENFDMVFKTGGTQTGLTRRLANIVAQLVSTLGGEPLSPERTSQIGNIAPRFRVTEAVREAPGLVQPRDTSKPQIIPSSGKPITSNEPVPSTPTDAAEQARALAVAAPKSSQEILGQVAEAIAQQAGIKINYLSAPGEPAAATSSNREARRAIIETFRTMPPEARALWEKTFFPERVVKLKGDKYQILGWAPEVFAANAHKLAAKLVELGVADASPYEIAGKTFTPEGWKQLFDDTQKFVKNQMAGRTGAGEPLVVPKGVTDAGFFAPPLRGVGSGLDQVRADFINMLFNFRLPDTARVQKGKVPLNIAGQDISVATKSGRVEVPVIPRGKFEGVEAERQGIAGREIMEVNPLRQQIEVAAQAKGVAMPEFIEAIQRLNLENIKDVQVAPEVPQFRGNTLTLSAGFQPNAEARAVKTAAVKDERGKVWEGFWHGDAEDAARTAGARGPFADGFTTNGGEFLNRQEAFTRAREMNQLEKNETPGIMDERGIPGLETSQLPEVVRDVAVDTAVKFQPPKNAEQAEELVKSVAKMSPEEFGKWATETEGFTTYAHQVGLKAPTQEFVGLLKAASDSFGKRAEELITTDIDAAMKVVSQQQFFREAWEAATGEGSAGFHFRQTDPSYQPKFPLDRPAITEDTSVQMQPKKELKLKPAGRDGVSKAWVLPDGKVVNIGGQWHHEYLNDNPALRKQYKLSDDTSQDNRLGALQKGFARINWSFGSGHLTIEARTKDWPKQREAIRSFVEANADKIDRMQVVLMSDNLKKVDDAHEVSVFTMEDNEKAAALPFGDLGDKRATGQASDRLFERAASKAQLQPALESELEKIRKGESSGQTFTSIGEVWTPGDKQVDIVTVASINVPTKDLTAEKYSKAIAPYAELLEDPNVVAGVFSLGPETASIDINAVVPQEHRENTKAFAKANDQMSIWDAVKFETVDTGGTGETKLKSIPQIKAALESLTQGEPVSVEDIVAQFQPAKDEYKKMVEKMDPPEGTRPYYDEAAEILDSGVTDFTKMEWSRIPLRTQRALIDIAKFDINHRPTIVGSKVHQSRVRGVGVEDKFTYRESVENMKIHPASMRPHFEAAADLLDTGVTEFTKKEWGEIPLEQQKAIHEIARFEPNFPYPKNRSSGEYKLFNIVKRLEAESGDSPSAQFQPEKDLFGFEKKLSIREIAKLPPERLREIYPEALVPEDVNESIPSAIVESPLYEKSGSEDAAVKAFSDGLVKFAQTVRQDPVAKAGAEWYDKFTPELKKEFGKDAQLMAELLAATSPNTGVETNFKFALDALDSFKSGRFTKTMSKFNQGMDMIANDTWKSWYNKELKNIPEPPQKPTAATFLEHWIYKHDLKPRQSNGKLYGIHSLPVLQVFARKWLSAARGPKTLNFIENLMGQSHEATIDVWADRTMRRIGYVEQERWRILPKNVRPVSDPDFEFAQKAFRHAADRLGMKPSALQGMLWFAEKKYWAEHGWADLNLGDFRTEMKKIPDIRAQRLTLTEKSGKIPSKQLDLK